MNTISAVSDSYASASSTYANTEKAASIQNADATVKTSTDLTNTQSATSVDAKESTKGASSLTDNVKAMSLENTLKQREEKQVAEEQEAKQQEQAEAIMQELNTQNLGLSFSINKDIDSTVISVLDKNTDDLVRQIPSEEFIRVSKAMKQMRENLGSTMDDSKSKDMLKGLLLDDQA